MDVFSSCLPRDLPVYRVTCESLRRHLADARLHVATRQDAFGKFRDACGSDLTLLDERELLPQMSLGELRTLPFPFFPHGAGWYFQQFLKFAFAERSDSSSDRYLIWDADTVLLKPIELADAEGRPIITEADEHHRPYFQTFEALFGEAAPREFSFISQHQVILKSVLREMLAEIMARNPEAAGWPQAIMANLRGEGANLFSEYETYGHYQKLRHPDSFVSRRLDWTRHGEKVAGYPPDPGRIGNFPESTAFAAFEVTSSPLRRFARGLKRLLGK